MNYLNIYNKLIEKAKVKNFDKSEYVETHHIIPMCMGGTNSPDNLVKLTYREHYIAHALLFKHYRSSKLAHAWFSMVRRGKGQQRYYTSRQFESAKRAHSDVLKESMRGEKNPFYGKKHSEETIDLLRNQKLGKTASLETREKMSLMRKGVPKSKEHKEKIGRKGLIVLKNISTGKTIRVPKENIKEYDSNWVNPYTYLTLNAKDATCPHCGMTKKDSSTFKRWHFDNCKENKHESN